MTDTIFNCSVAYDVNNREPLLYEEYPGSITDVTQLQCMLQKMRSFGYEHAGFILDRGCSSKKNIHYMDNNGYDFVMMVKGMKSTVSGTTIESTFLPGDKKYRYIHVYYNDFKAAAERVEFEEKIDTMEKQLKNHIGEHVFYGTDVQKYFDLVYWHEGQDNQVLQAVAPKTSVIDEAVRLCGYFTIITSQKMTVKEALFLYKGKDASEKMFRGDKSYLGDKAARVHSTESTRAKIFIEFVALIIRNRIYTTLCDEMERTDHERNYMTVPAAIRELEKIEMIRYGNDVYRLDHSITKSRRQF